MVPQDTSEQTPLLHQPPTSPDLEVPKRSTRRKVHVLAVVIIIVALFNIGSAVFQIPLNSLLEEHICKRIYADRPYDPDFCKGDAAVSSMQTFIDGWSGTFGLLPAVIFAIPYGLLADKWGRHRIILLTTIGLFLYVLHCVAVRKSSACSDS